MTKTETYCDVCGKAIESDCPHEYKLPGYEYYSPVLAEIGGYQITGAALYSRLAPKQVDICPECASKIKGFIDTLNPLQNSISSKGDVNE